MPEPSQRTSWLNRTVLGVAVNAVGDFLSSLLVGFLWSAFNVQIAFAASAFLFFIGAMLILRLR